MLNVILSGATGKVGVALAEAIADDSELPCTRPPHPRSALTLRQHSTGVGRTW